MGKALEAAEEMGKTLTAFGECDYCARTNVKLVYTQNNGSGNPGHVCHGGCRTPMVPAADFDEALTLLKNVKVGMVPWDAIFEFVNKHGGYGPEPCTCRHVQCKECQGRKE